MSYSLTQLSERGTYALPFSSHLLTNPDRARRPPPQQQRRRRNRARVRPTARARAGVGAEAVAMHSAVASGVASGRQGDGARAVGGGKGARPADGETQPRGQGLHLPRQQRGPTAGHHRPPRTVRRGGEGDPRGAHPERDQTGQRCLHVIVGKGTYSESGVGKLAPAVARICRELGLSYREEENAGRIYVWLRPCTSGEGVMPPGCGYQQQQHHGAGHILLQHHGGQSGYPGGQQHHGGGHHHQQQQQEPDRVEAVAKKVLPKIFKKMGECCVIM